MSDEQLHHLSLFASSASEKVLPNVVSSLQQQQQQQGSSTTEGSDESSSTNTNSNTNNNIDHTNVQYNMEVLDSILHSIASNLDMHKCYDWNQLYLFMSYKIHEVRKSFGNNQDGFEPLMQSIDHHFVKFASNPPFTLQRLCELLTQPNRHYKKLGHLLSSIEKCLTVNSFLSDFYDDGSGRHMELSQEEIMNDNTQHILEEENDVTMKDV